MKIEDCRDSDKLCIITADTVPQLTRRSVDILCTKLQRTGICKEIEIQGRKEDGKHILLEFTLRGVNRRRGLARIGRTLRGIKNLPIISDEPYEPQTLYDYEEMNRRSKSHLANRPSRRLKMAH